MKATPSPAYGRGFDPLPRVIAERCWHGVAVEAPCRQCEREIPGWRQPRRAKVSQ